METAIKWYYCTPIGTATERGTHMIRHQTTHSKDNEATTYSLPLGMARICTARRLYERYFVFWTARVLLYVVTVL